VNLTKVWLVRVAGDARSMLDGAPSVRVARDADPFQ
jgi:hypothetical protein